MPNIRLEDASIYNFLPAENRNELLRQAQQSHQELMAAGMNAMDWLYRYEAVEITKISSMAQEIQSQANAVVVLGVGGSQCGARAFIDALNGTFYNAITKASPDLPNIYWAGHNFSSRYLAELMQMLENREVALIVISKSGNTTETLLAFGVLQEYLRKRYGAAFKERIYVITGEKGGSLNNVAAQEGYRRLTIPSHVGGRYSVLSAVGLLPMAVTGIDIRAVLAGAIDAQGQYDNPDLENNPCYTYAMWRKGLYQSGKTKELLVSYENALAYLTAWWRQLFVESECKGGQGILPVIAEYSNDLHFLGQYLNEGPRDIFETVLSFDTNPANLSIDLPWAKEAGLPSQVALAGFMQQVQKTTGSNHIAAGVPHLEIVLPELTPYFLGEFVVFMVQACMVSANLMGEDPFGQPAIDAYKAKIRDLLK